jgi:hypothetical protein
LNNGTFQLSPFSASPHWLNLAQLPAKGAAMKPMFEVFVSTLLVAAWAYVAVVAWSATAM